MYWNRIKNKAYALWDAVTQWNASTVLLCAVFILVRAGYDMLYVFRVYPVYSYDGFRLSVTAFTLFESWFAYLLVMTITQFNRRNTNRLLQSVLDFFFLVIMLPASSLRAYGNVESTAMWLSALGFAIMAAAFFFFPFLDRLKIPFRIPKALGITLLALIFVSITAYSIIFMISLNGIPSFVAMDISRVYEIRNSIKDGALLGYTVPWTCKVILPFICCFALVCKKWWISVITFLPQLFLYLYNGEKFYLFLLPFMMGLVLISRFLSSSLVMSAGLLAACAIVSFLLPVSTIFFRLFELIRRIFSAPSYISTLYVEYTKNHSFVLFADGRLGGLLGTSSPYSLPFPKVIGMNYWGFPMHANNGFIASGYADWGVAGVMLMTIIIAGVFLVIAKFTTKKLYPLSFSFAGAYVISLSNSATLTVMLTHGLFLAMVVICLFSLTFPEKQPAPKSALPETKALFRALPPRIVPSKWAIRHTISLTCVILTIVLSVPCILTVQDEMDYRDTIRLYEYSGFPEETPPPPDVTLEPAAPTNTPAPTSPPSLNVKINDTVSENIRPPKSFEYPTSEAKNSVELLTRCQSLASTSIIDNAMYVISMAERISPFPQYQPDFDAAVALLKDTGKTDCSVSERYWSIKALLELYRKSGDTSHIPIIQKQLDFWREIDSTDALINSYASAILANAGTLEELSDEGLVEKATAYAELSMAAADTSMEFPVWYENGVQISFAKTHAILAGLYEFQSYVWPLPVLMKNVTKNNDTYYPLITPVKIGATASTYLYEKDHSFRPEGWASAYQSDPGDLPYPAEEDYRDVFTLLGMVNLSNITDYYYRQYSDSYENGVFQNPYEYLYFCHISGIFDSLS